MVKLSIQDFGVEDYEQDVFYNTQELTLEQKKEILEDARKLSFDWHVDVLDARKSWARQKIEMSFEDILKKLDEYCHFVFIHRKGFLGASGKALSGEYQLEIGFSTIIGDPSYFLFIHCDEKKLSKFLKKYHLVKQIR
jgi:hypothetical protein